MSRSGIRLSEKHGLNPSLAVCFWCGKERGDLVLLGRLKNDEEAPRYMVVDFEPCDHCREGMAQGFTLIEATTSPNSVCDREMQSGVYPTGRYVVVTKDAARRMFGDPNIKTGGKAFLEACVFDEMFGGLL